MRQSSPDLRFTNLAQHGLGVGEIREQQLEPALHLEPDIASVVAGANDIMTGRFDVMRWEEEFRFKDAAPLPWWPIACEEP